MMHMIMLTSEIFGARLNRFGERFWRKMQKATLSYAQQQSMHAMIAMMVFSATILVIKPRYRGGSRAENF